MGTNELIALALLMHLAYCHSFDIHQVTYLDICFVTVKLRLIKYKMHSDTVQEIKGPDF